MKYFGFLLLTRSVAPLFAMSDRPFVEAVFSRGRREAVLHEH